MTYEIIIRNGTGTGTGSPTASGQSNAQSEQQSDEVKTLSGLAVSAKIVNYAYKISSFNVGMTSVRTGQQEYQQKLQITQDAVFKLGNMAIKALITGKLLGSLSLGGVVTGITSTVNTITDIALRQQAINTQSTLENISIRQNNIRAGSNGNRGSRMNY